MLFPSGPAAVEIAVIFQNIRLRYPDSAVADPRLGSHRGTDKERHIGGAAPGGRSIERAIELGVALCAKRNRLRIDQSRCLARHQPAHEGADDVSDVIRRADRIATGENEPAHFEINYALIEIDDGIAVERRPRLTAAGCLVRGIANHIACLCYTDDLLPAHKSTVIGSAGRRKRNEKQCADRCHGECLHDRSSIEIFCGHNRCPSLPRCRG